MIQIPTPAFMADALCAQTDPETFYDPSSVDDAKAICAACPVRTDCLTWALETRDRFAVLGGMTPAERARPARRVRHGHKSGYWHHRKNGETPCDACKAFRARQRAAAYERQKVGAVG